MLIVADLPSSNAGIELQVGPFNGRETFRQNVRTLLGMAAVQEWPVLILSDPDFSDWPLDEKAVVQSLSGWSRRGRSITLLASSYVTVQSHHARFVEWRKRWDHIIHCRRLGELGRMDELAAVPSVIWTPDWVLHRTSLEKCLGLCTQSAVRRAELRESIDNCLKQSAPGFAASVLGL